MASSATTPFGPSPETPVPEHIKEETTEIYKNRPIRLSLHLIVKRHLPTDTKDWSQEKIIEELNKLKRVRLDRENLGEIDSLELLSTHVTNLYLQHNKISLLQNLECLPNLEVLVLSNNCISRIEGISHLEKLVFLDLSENNIAKYDISEIPKNVVILNLKCNECVQNSDHRKGLICSLPKLRQLDEMQITKKERMNVGIDTGVDVLGSDDDDDDEEEDDDTDSEDNVHESEIPKDEEKEKDESGSIAALHYRQLPQINSTIQSYAADMLLRSQNRLEDLAIQHKRHIQEMTNVCIKDKLRPTYQLSKPK